MAALLGRLIQSMFDGCQLRLQTYVDDPCATVAAPPPSAQRGRSIAILILVWRALGLRLPFKMGSKGTDVTWIGHRLQKEAQGVRIGVKPEVACRGAGHHQLLPQQERGGCEGPTNVRRQEQPHRRRRPLLAPLSQLDVERHRRVDAQSAHGLAHN